MLPRCMGTDCELPIPCDQPNPCPTDGCNTWCSDAECLNSEDYTKHTCVCHYCPGWYCGPVKCDGFDDDSIVVDLSNWLETHES